MAGWDRKKQLVVWVLSMVGFILVVFRSGPAPSGKAGINRLEKVRLGDEHPWIWLRGSATGAPVLLFPHGGPGSANLAGLCIPGINAFASSAGPRRLT
ncbi:MAG: hypothetical protein JXA13_01015 [Anaerolineales bacterium]|nr:hypothetical protein [Anaerolineales bacterium]